MRPGEAASPDEHLAEAAIAAVAEWRGATIAYRNVTAPVMSPMHRNVDSLCFAVDVEDRPYFLKIARPESRARVALRRVFEGTARAAAAGVGPRPSHCLDAHAAIVFERLDAAWRSARMDDLRRPPILAAVLAAKRAIHRGDRFGHIWSVFDGIRDLAGASAADAALEAMIPAIRDIETAMTAAGTDLAACHCDGLASNVMLGPGDDVRLVDFDNACDTDPLYEIGALLNETCTCAAEWTDGLEMWEERAHPATLARCRLYAVADDLYWALWARGMAAARTHPAIEFLKYAQWRTLRCQMALTAPDHARLLRSL